MGVAHGRGWLLFPAENSNSVLPSAMVIFCVPAAIVSYNLYLQHLEKQKKLLMEQQQETGSPDPPPQDPLRTETEHTAETEALSTGSAGESAVEPMDGEKETINSQEDPWGSASCEEVIDIYQENTTETETEAKGANGPRALFGRLGRMVSERNESKSSNHADAEGTPSQPQDGVEDEAEKTMTSDPGWGLPGIRTMLKTSVVPAMVEQEIQPSADAATAEPINPSESFSMASNATGLEEVDIASADNVAKPAGLMSRIGQFVERQKSARFVAAKEEAVGGDEVRSSAGNPGQRSSLLQRTLGSLVKKSVGQPKDVNLATETPAATNDAGEEVVVFGDNKPPAESKDDNVTGTASQDVDVNTDEVPSGGGPGILIRLGSFVSHDRRRRNRLDQDDATVDSNISALTNELNFDEISGDDGMESNDMSGDFSYLNDSLNDTLHRPNLLQRFRKALSSRSLDDSVPDISKDVSTNSVRSLQRAEWISSMRNVLSSRSLDTSDHSKVGGGGPPRRRLKRQDTPWMASMRNMIQNMHMQEESEGTAFAEDESSDSQINLGEVFFLKEEPTVDEKEAFYADMMDDLVSTASTHESVDRVLEINSELEREGTSAKRRALLATRAMLEMLADAETPSAPEQPSTEFPPPKHALSA